MFFFLVLQSVCPLHMQSLAVIDKTFTIAPSAFNFFGDIELYQVAHLLCISNVLDTKYNSSLLNYRNNYRNGVDHILENYVHRHGKLFS